MRLSLLSLLLLTAASTAVAADMQPQVEAEQLQGREAREERTAPASRGERQYRTDAPAQRPRNPDGPDRAERVERIRQIEPVRQVERAERVDQSATSPEPIRDVARAAVAQERGANWGRSPGPGAAAQGWRQEGRDRRSRARNIPPTAGSPVFGSAVPSAETVTRPGREVLPGVAGESLRERIASEGLRRDRIESENWRREWRQDRRYDWRRHRDRDRSRFHLGFYVDPFGWRYRDWDIGWRLPSRFYASRYWIHDPWYYRLPPVSGSYRWIRYHNDVLLVDLRSGRVLDRIRGFFW